MSCNYLVRAQPLFFRSLILLNKSPINCFKIYCKKFYFPHICFNLCKYIIYKLTIVQHEAWIFDNLMCKVFPFFFYTNFGASLLNITLIAINRYNVKTKNWIFKFWYPIILQSTFLNFRYVLISHYNLYNRVYHPINVTLMILFVWTFSFGLLILPLLGLWGTLGLDPSSFSCTILKKNGHSPKKFLFVFGILLPCITIILCYVRIFFKVRESKKALRVFR